VATSVFGLYYYLRIITLLFAEVPVSAPREKTLHPFFYMASYATVIVLVLLLLGIGVFPGVVINGIKGLLNGTLAASGNYPLPITKSF
jgi:NADH-quinone oxidoreductase subunit N